MLKLDGNGKQTTQSRKSRKEAEILVGQPDLKGGTPQSDLQKKEELRHEVKSRS